MTEWTEKDQLWSDILSTVSRGQVVPIVGDALSVVNSGAEPNRTVTDALAALIAERHEIHTEPGQERNLSAVLRHYRQFFHNRQRVFREISDAIRELQIPTPPPLADLARITDLKIFVSTTFDGLLPRTIDEVRFGGRPTTRVFTCSYKRDLDKDDVTDALSEAPSAQGAPVVIQLFGNHQGPENYALSEIEKVEFIHALRNPGPGVASVLQELKRHPILLLGTGFPDWLLRMLMRQIRHPFEETQQQYIAESAAVVDPMFRLFFCGLMPNTDLIDDADPAAFVSELARRWAARQTAAPAPLPPSVRRRSGEFQVFISYARTDGDGAPVRDAGVARAISDALKAVDIRAFIDSEQLKGGRDWKQQLREHINACRLFMPLISQTTEARDRGVFVEEWKMAIEAAAERKDWQRSFIFPVVIDDLDVSRAGMPREFKAVQITEMKQSAPDAGFVAAVKDALDAEHLERT
ncbi:MAG TPA: toll/interleukin-1 receptor domain-containing protein [Vicinamibacterales bacterium]|nr:toll/interleukin-1 receptor domain-containing protein [Vicinamibacterales bacterium]